jgi:hypothetical protein
LHVAIMPNPRDVQPMATGRSGLAHHSLQLPA